MVDNLQYEVIENGSGLKAVCSNDFQFLYMVYSAAFDYAKIRGYIINKADYNDLINKAVFDSVQNYKDLQKHINKYRSVANENKK